MYLSVELLGYFTTSQLQIKEFIQSPVPYYICGSLFLCLGILDIFTFVFQPAKLSIYIDQRQTITINADELYPELRVTNTSASLMHNNSEIV